MKYENPIIELMKLELSDVICGSGFGENPDIDNGDDDGGFAPR